LFTLIGESTSQEKCYVCANFIEWKIRLEREGVFLIVYGSCVGRAKAQSEQQIGDPTIFLCSHAHAEDATVRSNAKEEVQNVFQKDKRSVSRGRSGYP
jgi:hypothetical protein